MPYFRFWGQLSSFFWVLHPVPSQNLARANGDAKGRREGPRGRRWVRGVTPITDRRDEILRVYALTIRL